MPRKRKTHKEEQMYEIMAFTEDHIHSSFGGLLSQIQAWLKKEKGEIEVISISHASQNKVFDGKMKDSTNSGTSYTAIVLYKRIND